MVWEKYPKIRATSNPISKIVIPEALRGQDWGIQRQGFKGAQYKESAALGGRVSEGGINRAFMTLRRKPGAALIDAP